MTPQRDAVVPLALTLISRSIRSNSRSFGFSVSTPHSGPHIACANSGWSMKGLRLPCQLKTMSLRRRSVSDTASCWCHSSSVHSLPNSPPGNDFVNEFEVRSS